MRSILVPLALLAALAVAQGAGAKEVFERDVRVGDFAEKDLQLTAGQSVPWSIEVRPAERASYDLHSHDAGGAVTTHAGGEFTGKAEGTFVAPRAATYSWLVTNCCASQTLHVTIVTGADGQGSNGLPGFEPWALALGGLGLAWVARRPRRGATA